MARDASYFCLNSLSTTNLQAFRSGVRVESHVLRLKGCRMISVLQEDTTESSSNDALSYITARSGKHDGMEILHNLQCLIFNVIKVRIARQHILILEHGSVYRLALGIINLRDRLRLFTQKLRIVELMSPILPAVEFKSPIAK